jgi:uncharacterized membrane protein YeiH
MAAVALSAVTGVLASGRKRMDQVGRQQPGASPFAATWLAMGIVLVLRLTAMRYHITLPAPGHNGARQIARAGSAPGEQQPDVGGDRVDHGAIPDV